MVKHALLEDTAWVSFNKFYALFHWTAWGSASDLVHICCLCTHSSPVFISQRPSAVHIFGRTRSTTLLAQPERCCFVHFCPQSSWALATCRPAMCIRPHCLHISFAVLRSVGIYLIALRKLWGISRAHKHEHTHKHERARIHLTGNKN